MGKIENIVVFSGRSNIDLLPEPLLGCLNYFKVADLLFCDARIAVRYICVGGDSIKRSHLYSTLYKDKIYDAPIAILIDGEYCSGQGSIFECWEDELRYEFELLILGSKEMNAFDKKLPLSYRLLAALPNRYPLSQKDKPEPLKFVFFPWQKTANVLYDPYEGMAQAIIFSDMIFPSGFFVFFSDELQKNHDFHNSIAEIYEDDPDMPEKEELDEFLEDYVNDLSDDDFDDEDDFKAPTWPNVHPK